MVVDRKQCAATVSPSDRWGSFNPHRCERKAVVERDGRHYCKIHDPEYIRQKGDERRRKREKAGCQKCHWDLRRWWSFCPHCGTKVSSRTI